ncbi:MAG: hypothetical protein GY737_10510 [Desulfobacteraceae bacterium]|nr:hypothetical protein [Desulfobacteraceae bacterium]
MMKENVSKRYKGGHRYPTIIQMKRRMGILTHKVTFQERHSRMGRQGSRSGKDWRRSNDSSIRLHDLLRQKLLLKTKLKTLKKQIAMERKIILRSAT